MSETNNISSSTIIDHISTKDFWSGSIEAIPGTWDSIVEQDSSRLVMRPITGDHSPCALKCYDELIVNASDHCKACGGKFIRVTFDAQTGPISSDNPKQSLGLFTCTNDGSGISNIPDSEGIYPCARAFTIPLSGANVITNANSIKGGTNGIGAKLALAHSLEFTYRNRHGGKEVSQTARANSTSLSNTRNAQNRVVSEPVVKTKFGKPEVFVSALLDFAKMYPEFTGREESVLTEISQMLHLRCLQIAAYLDGIASVSYNGINLANPRKQILEVYFGVSTEHHHVRFTAQNNKHSIDLNAYFIIGREIDTSLAGSLSIINGVFTPKGTHINAIRDIILRELNNKKIQANDKSPKKKQAKDCVRKVTWTQIRNLCSFAVIGTVTGAKWDGQNKNNLQLSIPNSAFSGNVEKIAKLLEPLIKEEIAIKTVENIKKSISAPRGKSSLGIPAKKFRPAEKQNCRSIKKTLLVVEGSSANNAVLLGIKELPDKANYGIYTIRGVPLNTRRQRSIVVTHSSGQAIRQVAPSERLMANNEFLEIIKILGLDITKEYKTEYEYNSLRYSNIIVCTDQDIDGIGRIFPLVADMIFCIWPALLEHGLISRWLSPVIKMANGKSPLYFYSEQQYKDYIAKHEKARSRETSHIKGLASNSPTDFKQLFKRFHETVQRSTVDEDSERLMEECYGPDSAPRKQMLATLKRAEVEEFGKELSLSNLVRTTVLDFKHNDNRRHLPHLIDGLNNAQRKVATLCLQEFAKSNKEKKVTNLAGRIIDKLEYLHGDDSISTVILHMADRSAGSLDYPLLIPNSIITNRENGALTCPRYVYITLNSAFANAMFPREDMYILPREISEGKVVEPTYLAPVIPYGLMLNRKAISEGWRYRSISRNPADLVAAIHAIMEDEELIDLAEAMYDELDSNSDFSNFSESRKFDLPPHPRQFAHAKVENIGGDYYMICEHVVRDNVIEIYELPPFVRVDKFIQKYDKLDIVKDIQKLSIRGDNNIGVRITLTKAIDNTPVDGFTPIMTMFGLRYRLGAELNVYYEGTGAGIASHIPANTGAGIASHIPANAGTGRCLQFGDNYGAMIFIWFIVRARLYKVRVERQKIIAEARMLLNNEILRYLESGDLEKYRKLNSGHDEFLASRGYAQLNIDGPVREIGMTDNNVLRQKIYSTEAAGKQYNYLHRITARDMAKDKRDKLREKNNALSVEIARYDAYLAEKPIPCVSLWKSEIDTVLSNLPACV